MILLDFNFIGYQPEVGEFVYMDDDMYVVVEVDAVNQLFEVELICKKTKETS